MSLPQTFSIPTGEDFTITIKMSPATTITGWTLSFTAVGNPISLIGTSDNPATPAVPYLKYDNASLGGLTVSDSTLGVILIDFAAADTANMTPGMFQWVLRRTDTDAVTSIADGLLYLIGTPVIM